MLFVALTLQMTPAESGAKFVNMAFVKSNFTHDEHGPVSNRSAPKYVQQSRLKYRCVPQLGHMLQCPQYFQA
jgi:hypothetical protein